MILSIESSCDDSSIALTSIVDGELIFEKKISQITHSHYGGVVPEVAAREHAKALPLILEEVMPHFPQIKAIAVTHTPGLSLTLLEGVMMAKALCVSLKLPLIGVNHLYGHMYSLFVGKETTLPQIALLVSGGHTAIFEIRSFDNIAFIGGSLDDSVGESYDKVAKMLDLGYPGGPAVEELAREGDENRFRFPVALQEANAHKIAFSYSGLKNAVRLQINASRENDTLFEDIKDICASFQKAASTHLEQKVFKVLVKSSVPNVAVVGGVSNNDYIRNRFAKMCAKLDKQLFTPQKQFCSDNAAMIGRYALELYRNERFTPYSKLEVSSRFL